MASVILFPKVERPTTSAKPSLPGLLQTLGHTTDKLNRYVSASAIALVDNLHRIDTMIETLEDGPVKFSLRDQSSAIRSALTKLSA